VLTPWTLQGGVYFPVRILSRWHKDHGIRDERNASRSVVNEGPSDLRERVMQETMVLHQWLQIQQTEQHKNGLG
jgi:hypothetical protein